jgi:hypothetical protein
MASDPSMHAREVEIQATIIEPTGEIHDALSHI